MHYQFKTNKIMNNIGITIKIRVDVTDEELVKLLEGNRELMNNLLKKKVGKEIKQLDYCYISSEEVEWFNETKGFNNEIDDIDFQEED